MMRTDRITKNGTASTPRTLGARFHHRRSFARERTSLPAASRAMTWHAVANVGRVVKERMPNGRIRFWLDFGRRVGRRIRLYSMPNPAGGVPIGFTEPAMANRVLEAIRSSMVEGKSLEQSVAAFCGRASPEDLVEVQLRHYLDHFEALVEQGARSPNTLRELRRYAGPGGPYSCFFGKPIYAIRYADIEDWHLELGKTGVSQKTMKNVSDAFRTFLRWTARRGLIDRAPDFPKIRVPEFAPRILDIEQQQRVIAAIPWERRGAFLAAATEALRLSEVRALDLDDWQDGKLHLAKAVQGRRVDARISHTKTRAAEWREPWSEDLIRWIEWRLEQATPESRRRGEVALFWNPSARNPAKRWGPDAIERQWDKACEDALGFRVPFQQGTRHTTLTALGQKFPERMLRAFSRHRDGRSLDRYSKPVAPPEETARALAGSRRGGR